VTRRGGGTPTRVRRDRDDDDRGEGEGGGEGEGKGEGEGVLGSEVIVRLRANESVLVVLDGFRGATGTYRLEADRL
jgi:hypothetical protein